MRQSANLLDAIIRHTYSSIPPLKQDCIANIISNLQYTEYIESPHWHYAYFFSFDVTAFLTDSIEIRRVTDFVTHKSRIQLHPSLKLLDKLSPGNKMVALFDVQRAKENSSHSASDYLNNLESHSVKLGRFSRSLGVFKKLKLQRIQLVWTKHYAHWKPRLWPSSCDRGPKETTVLIGISWFTWIQRSV